MRMIKSWEARQDARHCKLCTLDIFPDPPQPDPAIGRAAEASTEVGLKSLDLAKDQFAWAKELGTEQLGLARKVVDQQTRIADTTEQRGGEQWDRYTKVFAPVEDRMVKDALEYDSPAEMDRRAAQAGADVSASADAGRMATSRALTRRGVNVNSGNFVAGLQPIEVAKAAATAGGMNAAREGVHDRAIGLRAGAASFGRGLPNTAAQAYGLATGAGTSATNNLNSTAGAVVT